MPVFTDFVCLIPFRSIIDKAAQKVTLPSIRQVLTNGWNVHNPDRCIALLEVVGIVYPTSVLDDLIDMMVQPKIAAGVKAWLPTHDVLPIHTWLHPWLPLMKSKLSSYYPEIRRKLGQALMSWDPIDTSAVAVLQPWKDVFDKDSMEKFLSRVIIPKLVVSLRGILINPSNQDITIFNSIIAWYGLIPNIHIISLFQGEFFTKWLRVLLNWLLISPDFAEVSQWYSGWKSSFPPTLLEDVDMMAPFNTALTLMNIAITAEEEDLEGELNKEAINITQTSYFACIEKKLSEMKARERLDQLNQDNRYVFSRTGDGTAAYHGQGMYCLLLYLILHHTILRYTILHYTTLHYTTLHYTTLHYTILYYTILGFISNILYKIYESYDLMIRINSFNYDTTIHQVHRQEGMEAYLSRML